MEKNKSKAVLIIIMVLLLLIIAGLVCYIVIDKNHSNNGETTQNSPIPETPKIPTKIEEERALTTIELQEIRDYLKNGKTNFLASEFKNPKEVNLYFQIIYGYDDDLVTSVATKQELFDIGMDEELIEFNAQEGWDTIKIAKEDMDKYLKDNLDVSTADVDLSWMEYSEKYNAYYYGEPSDAFDMNVMFIVGKINEEGLYVIEYTGDYDYNWTLTLKKDGEKYKFLSNINSMSDKIEKIRDVKDLKSKKVYYNQNLNCTMYYKDNTLYYAELIGDTYYFENSECFACVTSSIDRAEYYDYSIIGERIYKKFISEVIS